MRKVVISFCIFILTIVVGCSKDSPTDSFERELQDSEHVESSTDIKEVETIKIMINMDPKEFDQLYGDAFKQLHPETKLELVQRNSYRSINDNITRLQPDIIFNISGLDYNEAVKSGYLKEIDRELVDIGRLYPPVVSYLETYGNGGLYGMATQFTISGIKFNKKLFDQYKIKYPANNITWDDFFQLCKEFPSHTEGAEKLYGFYFHRSDPIMIVYTMRRAFHLSYLDEQGVVNLHTPSWRQLITRVLEGYSNGYFPPQPIGKEKFENFFEENLAAMTLDSIQLHDNTDNYGFVLEPTVLDANQITQLIVSNIITISAQTNHLDAALKFFQFANSEEVARQNLDQIYGLPARIDLIPESKQAEFAPFLTGQIDVEEMMKNDTNNSQYDYALHDLWREVVEKYLKHDITTIDEVIEMMEKGAAKVNKIN